MSGKCTLFACCPLLMYYSSLGREAAWEKKYCAGNFRKCPRYMLERMEGRDAGQEPRKSVAGTFKREKPNKHIRQFLSEGDGGGIMTGTDVTDREFGRLVLEKSRHVPVVVDFWAPWCGPCLALGTVLEKLSSEYARRFALAKVNVDGNTEMAVKYGVSDIPAVKMFRDGKVAAEFTGARAEKVIRAWLEKNL